MIKFNCDFDRFGCYEGYISDGIQARVNVKDFNNIHLSKEEKEYLEKVTGEKFDDEEK